MSRKFMSVISTALAIVLLSSGAVLAQGTQGGGSSGGTAAPNTAKSNLDLPMTKPQGEITTPQLPPPPEEPEPEEEPPTFHGEPIPSENSTIFYVIDESCSMGWDNRSYVDDEGNTRSGNRMARAKSELRKSVRALPRSFKFNIIAYGCSIKRHRGAMVEATPNNKNAAVGWINGLNPNDGTMTGPATAAALADKNNMSVVLLTDGSPNCGASGTSGHRNVINAANTQNAVITVFGIGATGSLRSFCQQVASDNGGTYVDVP